MQFTYIRTVQVTSFLLLILAATQATYTVLSLAGVSIPRQFLWGVEGVLFTILTAFAGAALVQTKGYQVGWAAIAFSAVLNVVQVSVGVTLFMPLRDAASQFDALDSVAGAVVALSFMIYYSAKLLLGFAALIFGMAKMKSGSKILGGLTLVFGAVAMFANTILVVFGRDVFLPSAVAGGFGVLATVFLALCLNSVVRDDS